MKISFRNYWGKSESRAGGCERPVIFRVHEIMPNYRNTQHTRVLGHHKRNDLEIELLIHQYAQRHNVDKS